MITDTIKYLDHPVAIACDINPKDKHNSFLLVLVTLRTHIIRHFVGEVSHVWLQILQTWKTVPSAFIGIYISFIWEKSTKARAIVGASQHHQCSWFLLSFCSTRVLKWLLFSGFLHGHKRTAPAPNVSSTFQVGRRKKGGNANVSGNGVIPFPPFKELPQKPLPNNLHVDAISQKFIT